MCAHPHSLQYCLTLCNPVGCSPPGSSVPGILQARALKGAAISCPRASSWPRDRTHFSCVSSIRGKFFTHWATWEAHLCYSPEIFSTVSFLLYIHILLYIYSLVHAVSTYLISFNLSPYSVIFCLAGLSHLVNLLKAFFTFLTVLFFISNFFFYLFLAISFPLLKSHLFLHGGHLFS